MKTRIDCCRYAQWTMYWINFPYGKHLGVIISNNYYNMNHSEVYVATLLRIKADVKFQDNLLIQTRQDTICSIRFSSGNLSFIERAKLRPENYYGTLTNPTIQESIISAVNNLVDPDYNSQELYNVDDSFLKSYSKNIDFDDDEDYNINDSDIEYAEEENEPIDIMDKNAENENTPIVSSESLRRQGYYNDEPAESAFIPINYSNNNSNRKLPNLLHRKAAVSEAYNNSLLAKSVSCVEDDIFNFKKPEFGAFPVYPDYPIPSTKNGKYEVNDEVVRDVFTRINMVDSNTIYETLLELSLLDEEYLKSRYCIKKENLIDFRNRLLNECLKRGFIDSAGYNLISDNFVML